MAASILAVSECLCYLFNKYDKATTVQLKLVMQAFFTDQELCLSKETLHAAISALNDCTEVPRLIKRKGDSRVKANVEDVCDLMHFVDERNLRNSLPTFVAVNVDRIPNVTIEDMELFVMKQHLEKFETRLAKLEVGQLLSAGNSSLTVGVGSSYNTAQSVPSVDSRDIQSVNQDMGPSNNVHTTGVNGSRSTLSLGDVPNDGVQRSWSTVAARPPRINNRYSIPGNSAMPAQRSTAATNKKKRFIGVKTSNTKVASAVEVYKKLVLHVDNVSNAVTCDDLKEFLMEANVKVETCFTVKSWMRNAAELDITSFRLCIRLDDKSAVFDSEFWPKGVIIREWRFKKQTKSSETGQDNAA